MTRRLTKRDLEAISEALNFRLAGIFETGDYPREQYDAAQEKIDERLKALSPDRREVE